MTILSRKQIADLAGCKPEDIPRAPHYSLTSYTPPGPVCAGYIRSLGPIDCITGPAGSGKTVGSIFKAIRLTIGVMPVCTDGVIRVRGTVLRDNYRALYRTTLRSWFTFFPPDWAGSTFTGGQDRPAQHILKLSTVRNGREVPVELTVDFFAVGDVAIEELLKGYETSWIWANEADLLHPRVVPFSYSRTGRYPPRELLPPGTVRPRVVICDFNPTPPKHPLWLACKTGSFQTAERGVGDNGGPPLDDDGVAASVNFFQQPSGLSPQAENRAGKTLAEYEEDARTLTEEDVRRFVHGLPGYASDGKPVYAREFKSRIHVAAGPIPVLRNRPVLIGFDQGMTPAALIAQEDTFGQLRILREVFLGHGVGASRFIDAMRAELHGRFRGLPPGTWGSDPSGFYGADKQRGELTWSEMVGVGLGHNIMPAPTNEVGARIEAVRAPLRLMLEADKPAILIDPEGCPLLIEGFEAEYKFRKKPDHTYEAEPLKNDYANLHDALQYLILTHRGRQAVIDAAAFGQLPGNVTPLAGRSPSGDRMQDFNVFG
jgi:hypothetical protein